MKRSLTLAIAMALALALAAPATAGPRRPPDLTVTQHNVLRDDAACGSYGVVWDINLTVDIWRFTDEQGRLVRLFQHVTEDNTVTNTVTGLTLRDGPVDFNQVNVFDPETGLLDRIEVTGVSVNVVRGDQRLVDRGPIVIDGQTSRIIRSAGPHPVRELLDGSTDINLALPAFCDILR